MLLDPKLIWYAYSSVEEGSNLLVQMISTCRHGLKGRGYGVGTLGNVPTGVTFLLPVDPFPQLLPRLPEDGQET